MDWLGGSLVKVIAGLLIPRTLDLMVLDMVVWIHTTMKCTLISYPPCLYFPCMYVNIPGALGDQKGATDFLKLELQQL